MKAIDCMVQHIKTFHTQAIEGAEADFGEPCQTCPYAGTCNFDWISVMNPLLSKTKIKVNMLMPELICKNESIPASVTDLERAANTVSRAVQEYLSELNK